MRSTIWLRIAFLLLFVLGFGGCRKYVTEPTTRRPVISSVVAFPTVLGPGDSTIITIFATDPDGDSLVYDWWAYNGLILKGAYPRATYVFGTRSPTMVFYGPTTLPFPVDTAFVWCTARDQKGGSDQRQVLIVYEN